MFLERTGRPRNRVLINGFFWAVLGTVLLAERVLGATLLLEKADPGFDGENAAPRPEKPPEERDDGGYWDWDETEITEIMEFDRLRVFIFLVTEVLTGDTSTNSSYGVPDSLSPCCDGVLTIGDCSSCLFCSESERSRAPTVADIVNGVEYCPNQAEFSGCGVALETIEVMEELVDRIGVIGV
ncbi:hypothetical protein OGATHE_004749 [Ogataea polymorpha]|uniref:Uncharacterized protein n=1 Tax=Ogataea polymorpha TaxID=460523 RepID=A0A9P8NZP5_9ASCO|nr:hypothetical protein OGATHE_004749 [Ogataea polymorpha]